MSLVKFDYNGRPVYINSAHVISLTSMVANSTVIVVTASGKHADFFSVRGSIDEVANKLNAADR